MMKIVQTLHSWRELYKKYNLLLAPGQKWHILGFFICIILGALLETVSIGFVLPLIVVLIDPAAEDKYVLLRKFCSVTGIYEQDKLLLALLIIFLAVVLFKNLFLYIMNIYRRDFTVASSCWAQQHLFNIYLHCDYEDIINKDSSELIRNIVNFPPQIFALLNSILRLLAEVLVLVFVLSMLFWINWRITLLICVSCCLLTLFVYKVFLRREHQLGAESNLVYIKAMNSVRDAILGFKELKLLDKERFFYETMCENVKANMFLEKEKSKYAMITPHIIECVVFASACIYIVFLVSFGVEVSEITAQLGVAAIAALRIIPAFNRINGAGHYIAVYLASLELLSDEVVQYLREEEMYSFPHYELLPFKDSVELRDVTFRYALGRKNILSEANFKLIKGQKVGVVGLSGAGKTTFVDLFLGYLYPQKGGVFVDGVDIMTNIKGWMKNLGYIPQMIFMLNDTIRNNVLFGTFPEGDEKVWHALEKAQLADFVRSLPDGLDTVIGERGIRISGGERQRVGIARCLYNDAEILVFDEATSALDSVTEKQLMREIYALEKTMVIISHNETILSECDVVYKVQDGKVYC